MWTDAWKELIAGSKFKEMPDFGTARKGHVLLCRIMEIRSGLRILKLGNFKEVSEVRYQVLVCFRKAFLLI